MLAIAKIFSRSLQWVWPLLYRCGVHHQMLHNVLEALKKTKKSQSNWGKQTLVIGVHVVCSSKQHKSLYNSQHASLCEWV